VPRATKATLALPAPLALKAFKEKLGLRVQLVLLVQLLRLV